MDLLKVRALVGKGLADSVRATVAANQLAAPLMQSGLKKLQSFIDSGLRPLIALNEGFAELEVPESSLEPGAAEIELRIPVATNHDTLLDLSTEAKEWDQDLT